LAVAAMLNFGFALKSSVIEKKNIITKFFSFCLVVPGKMLTHDDDEHKVMIVELKIAIIKKLYCSKTTQWFEI
jgi:hypothetical protein